ncbi:MAG: SPW repeat protein [Phycicoccus sp.]|nr:SPW repeat protein [Phycicoccus sp.]NMM33022.1 SPW repeat protein [Phycicoccus sp.]
MTGKKFLGWAALIAGLYAAVSPIWVNYPADTNKGLYTMIGLGVITAALAIAALYRPGVATDSLIALMGVLFIVAPWVMSFSDTAYRPMAWTAWIVGAVSLVAGAAEFQLERSEQQHTVTNR